MKRRLLAMFAAVVLAAGAPLAAGQYQPASDKNPVQSRELQGKVLNKSDAPVADAVVYLKNTKTLAVVTYITGPDGAFRFSSLAQNVDYDVYAQHQGKRSDTKTLSAFDSRPKAYINLKVDTER